ncbi:aminoglycoside phosphotransferase [Methylocella silvestris BL2]|uniref:Aminoglycoside phosphotransferase n=1 Tax=Methylocella silvestris (strain DSM 15510 / CIP 108128 / LMG 27833 / NCIMB 13906 / BL2) TaxID=395965 RepID=B8EIC4_METSB|nr:fructosamine kinase family protein [Methylocella silvestris]ACK51243.1 aminoglycoside phosphotransferase [Methylocella silvestris BL2]
MRGLAERGAALLGGLLRHAERVSGGDLSQILRVTLEDGRQAIVKTGSHPKIEAAMLRAIAASGAPAPSVLAVSDEVLALELLPGGEGLGGAWASLGHALATLHAASGARYGWPEDYAFGPVAIENGWSDDWPRFWAARRLLTHVAHLPAALARRVEALAAALPDRLPAQPRLALLHGDLWGGNIVAAGGRVSGFIDPACYYGDAEVDLAMLSLFDQPGAPFFDAYGPLEPGHEDRRPIYMLWPALVHLRLFGGAYRPMASACCRPAGSKS